MSWQPIETAPKDGTRFLMTYWDLDYVWFELGLWSQADGGHWMDCFENGKFYPTHWMPLPNPPQDLTVPRKSD